jgi:hypothetical protein
MGLAFSHHNYNRPPVLVISSLPQPDPAIRPPAGFYLDHLSRRRAFLGYIIYFTERAGGVYAKR